MWKRLAGVLLLLLVLLHMYTLGAGGGCCMGMLSPLGGTLPCAVLVQLQLAAAVVATTPWPPMHDAIMQCGMY
jgi:hypothetical protein